MPRTSAAARPVPTVSDEWRRWIAENLMLGTAPEGLVAVLRQSGFTTAQAGEEVERALRSPYLHGAARLHNRLAKRDWLLEMRSQLRRIAPPPLRRRHQLDSDTFLREHYIANEPVILTGMLDDVVRDPCWSLDHLREYFGGREVEIQAGRTQDGNYEQNSLAHKRLMRFADYVDLVRAGASNDIYMTANNSTRNREALAELWPHMPRVPEYLKEEEGKPQGFFWFGPAGTITPFHHDLTNNVMMQLVGRKRVRLVSPSDTPRMYNDRHCFTPVDGAAPDVERWPLLREVEIIDCVLEPGEILFLPVGWWHYVEALDISITIAATHFRWDNDFYSRYPTQHDF